jgi:hypothetical protein
MKQNFAEYTFIIRGAAKRAGVSIADYFNAARALSSQQCTAETGVSGDEFDSLIMRLAVEKDILEGSGTRYFVDSESLATWLPTTIRQYSASILDVLGETAGIIHTPGKSGLAVCFGVVRCPSGERVLSVGSGGRTIVGWEIDERFHFDRNPLADLVFGLALYIRCFPHAVRDGFPESAAHPSHWKGKPSVTVSAIDEVVSHRTGVIPHLRKGHFRTLRSPVFTNSRWKVLWIDETEVAGAVKTVVEVAR